MLEKRFLVLVTLLLLSLPLAAAEDPLAELNWISGAWAGERGGVRSEEYWSKAAGGMLLGHHRDLFEGGRSFFEFLRIVQRGDEIFYIAMPRGERTTEFRLVESGPDHAIFENPGHDFPQKIEYRRDGETLSARIEGNANGEIRSTGWQWKRVQPE